MLGLAVGILFAHVFKLPKDVTGAVGAAGEGQKKSAPQFDVRNPRRNAVPIGA